MLGQFVQPVVAETRCVPVDAKRRSMEVANCSATSDVTDSVCAVALPGAISSPMWSRRKPHGAMATDNTSVILSSGARAVELQWRLTRIAARL